MSSRIKLRPWRLRRRNNVCFLSLVLISVSVRWCFSSTGVVAPELTPNISYLEKQSYDQEEVQKAQVYYDHPQIKTVAWNKTCIEFLYPPFLPDTPSYSDTTDRDIFLRYKAQYTSEAPGYLVNFIENGYVNDYTHSCTDGSSSGRKRRSPGPLRTTSSVLFPVLMKATCSLHDVITWALPVIAQSAEHIRRHNATIMLPGRCDAPSVSLIDSMEVSPEPATRHIGGNYRGQRVIETCAAPAMSPALWRKMRTLLHVPTTQSDYGWIVFITKGTLNGKSVSVLNKQAVISRLSDIYGDRLLVIYDALRDIQSARDIFEKAAIVIGIPCDQMDMVVFSPPGITVIEFSPSPGTAAPRSSWGLATSLGHRYALGYEAMSTREGSCAVSSKRLVNLLRRLGHLDANKRPQVVAKKLSLQEIDNMLL